MVKQSIRKSHFTGVVAAGVSAPAAADRGGGVISMPSRRRISNSNSNSKSKISNNNKRINLLVICFSVGLLWCLILNTIISVQFLPSRPFLRSHYNNNSNSNKQKNKMSDERNHNNNHHRHHQSTIINGIKKKKKNPCMYSVHTETKWEDIEHPASEIQNWLLNNMNINNNNYDLNNSSKKMLSVPYMYHHHQQQQTQLGDERTTLSLEQAKAIGSVVYLDNIIDKDDDQHHHNQQIPESKSAATTKTPTESEATPLETINVMIASFRDGTMCKNTISGIFTRAKYPHRVRVTVVDQVLLSSKSSPYYSLPEDEPCTVPTVPCSVNQSQVLCQWKDYIDTLSLDALDSSGPCFSRHLSYRMYRGEYFVLQTDSHVEFTMDWDDDIIQQWKSTNNEMAVLTVYPDDVKYIRTKATKERINNSNNNNTQKRTMPNRAIMCKTIYEKDEDVGIHLRHDQQPSLKPNFDDGRLQLEPFWAAGFSFSRGHFVLQVMYDLYLPHIFQGEETNIGIRGFTSGYDFYAPSRPVVYHYYNIPNKNKNNNDKNKKRKKRLKFWDLPTYNEDVAYTAMQRLNTIIELFKKNNTSNNNNNHRSSWFSKDSKLYGLGTVRSVDQYYQLFGIHRNNQSIEDNLCMFVASRAMNEMFLPALREDTMGIDYSHRNLRNFSFHNKWPCKDYWFYSGDEEECDDGDEIEKDNKK